MLSIGATFINRHGKLRRIVKYNPSTDTYSIEYENESVLRNFPANYITPFVVKHWKPYIYVDQFRSAIVNIINKCECGCHKTYGTSWPTDKHYSWCPIHPNYKAS